MRTKSKNFIIVFSCLLMFFGGFLPAPEGLSSDAMHVIGIFLGSVLMWMTIAIDWPSLITLVAIGLMPVFGFNFVFQKSFGADTFPFLVFTFMLTYPLSKTDFIRRCTIAFITNKFAQKGPWYFVAFLFAAVTFLGCFISPSVLFVAFMPFLEDIYAVLGLKKGSRTAELIMLGTAFCTCISSGMTPIGHVWPTLAIGFANSMAGVVINQFQFMAVCVPTGIICIALMFVVFKFFFKPEDISEIDQKKAESLKEGLAKPDRKEIVILAAMLVTIFLWVAPSLLQNAAPSFYSTVKGWTTAMPPLIGCIILSVATDKGKSIMDFKEATSKGVLWASPIMCASTLVLASCLTSSDIGITAWIGAKLGPIASNIPVFAFVAFVVFWTILQTNFASNIATTNLVCSVAIPLVLSLGIGGAVSADAALDSATASTVAIVASLIGMGAGFSFMTPPGMTAVNGVAAASGWTNAKNMFVWGGILAAISVVVFSCISYPLGMIIF